MHEIINRRVLKWDAQPLSWSSTAIGASAEVIMPELVNRGELKWDAQPCSGRAPPEVSSLRMPKQKKTNCTGCGEPSGKPKWTKTGIKRTEFLVDDSGKWCTKCLAWMDKDWHPIYWCVKCRRSHWSHTRHPHQLREAHRRTEAAKKQ